jgi:hypothetical protein
MPTGGPGAATNLVAQPDCDPEVPGRSLARLSWTAALRPGREQRVAVTIYANGFERGEFDTSKVLQPHETNFVWKQLRGQAIHFWTVLTLQGERWVPSEPGKFVGPTCVMDNRLRLPQTNSGKSTNQPQGEIRK